MLRNLLVRLARQGFELIRLHPIPVAAGFLGVALLTLLFHEQLRQIIAWSKRFRSVAEHLFQIACGLGQNVEPYCVALLVS